MIVDLAKRVFLVTGSTDGIGRHTALKLAQAGATVLVHGRNSARVEQTQKAMISSTNNDRIFAYTADLSSLTAVRRLAEDVRRDHEKIDVLINNAGVFEDRRKLSEDGFEMTWAVNVLAPFLLTSCLLPLVTHRILNIASISAASHIDFDNLQQERGYSSHNAYSLSKLASILFTFKLADMVKGSGVTVNCCDPGTVNTKMLYAGWGPCGIDVQTADDQFFLATHSSLQGVSGKYFVHSRERPAPRVAYDQQVQDRLWCIMEEQTQASYSTAVQQLTT